jgi:spore coat protein CotH
VAEGQERQSIHEQHRASFGDLGDNKESYRTLYEKKTNEDADDYSDLIGLVAAINRSSSEEFLENVSERIDIDSVLIALALDNATVNLDSYVGMAQNYYVYRRADNKFVWIPWDPSLAFGALAQGVTSDQMKTLALEWTTTQGAGFPGGGLPPGGGVPPPGGGFGGLGGGNRGSNARPLATKLWAIPSVKARYTELYRQLSNFAFLPEAMIGRMNEIRS